MVGVKEFFVFRGRRLGYHPAAFERAADSTRGVEIQGWGRFGGGRLPMLSIYLYEDCYTIV